MSHQSNAALQSIPVKMYQKDQLEDAGAFVHAAVARGEVAGAFVYGASPTNADADPDEAWGSLHVHMPLTHGVTYPGHEALKRRFYIQAFRQKECIVLWLKDSALEDAVAVLRTAIAPEEQKGKP